MLRMWMLSFCVVMAVFFLGVLGACGDEVPEPDVPTLPPTVMESLGEQQSLLVEADRLFEKRQYGAAHRLYAALATRRPDVAQAFAYALLRAGRSLQLAERAAPARSTKLGRRSPSWYLERAKEAAEAHTDPTRDSFDEDVANMFALSAHFLGEFEWSRDRRLSACKEWNLVLDFAEFVQRDRDISIRAACHSAARAAEAWWMMTGQSWARTSSKERAKIQELYGKALVVHDDQLSPSGRERILARARDHFMWDAMDEAPLRDLWKVQGGREAKAQVPSRKAAYWRMIAERAPDLAVAHGDHARVQQFCRYWRGVLAEGPRDDVEIELSMARLGYVLSGDVKRFAGELKRIFHLDYSRSRHNWRVVRWARLLRADQVAAKGYLGRWDSKTRSGAVCGLLRLQLAREWLYHDEPEKARKAISCHFTAAVGADLFGLSKQAWRKGYRRLSQEAALQAWRLTHDRRIPTWFTGKNEDVVLHCFGETDDDGKGRFLAAQYHAAMGNHTALRTVVDACQGTAYADHAKDLLTRFLLEEGRYTEAYGRLERLRNRSLKETLGFALCAFNLGKLERARNILDDAEAGFPMGGERVSKIRIMIYEATGERHQQIRELRRVLKAYNGPSWAVNKLKDMTDGRPMGGPLNTWPRDEAHTRTPKKSKREQE